MSCAVGPIVPAMIVDPGAVASELGVLAGTCPTCGNRCQGFASGSDWWHVEATDCPTRRRATAT